MNSDDFADLLKQWPYEPGTLLARRIDCGEGPPRLQVRVEMGLIQLETVGRPDGLRPDGFESVFDVVRHRFDADNAPIEPGECDALQKEAALYSYRSLIYSTLEDYAGVLRDTNRNIQVMEFIGAHAQQEHDQIVAREGTLQLLMMRARARATIAVRDGDHSVARSALDSGIEELRIAMHVLGREADLESSSEYRLLRGMRDMLMPQLPASQRQEIRERLEQAIAHENYELAAILTAELRQLP